MNKKIFLYSFGIIILIGFIGIVLSAGETTTTIEKGAMKEIFANILGNGINVVGGENGNTITFLDGGSLNISGVLYENVESGSLIRLNNNGEIINADLTATEKTVFTFGKNDYEIPEGGRIKYDGSKASYYGKSGDSFRYKSEVLDEYGKNIGKFMDIKINGESVNIEKIGENSIFTGNFDMGNNKIVGLNENVGKITLSKEGKISEIWKGTDVTMNNVDFKVLGDNLKMYYDENFVASSHVNENYFNYGKNKINMGGIGFSSDLGKTNNIFGDMKTTKVIDGIGTKTRDLSFILNGGNLEISKDISVSDDLSFNVKGDGDYIINNGKAVIYSQKGYVKDNKGKYVLSDENNVFVKVDSSKGFSYDINLNNDEYSLENNIFKDDKGNVLINTNTNWENTVNVARDTSLNEARDIRVGLQEEGKKIYVDDPNFLTWIQGGTGEAIMKEIYTATDTANLNIYGVKISPLEVYTAMKSEAAGFTEGGKRTPLFGKYSENPNWNILGMEAGLSDCGSSQEIAMLKEEGFIQDTLNVKEYIVGSYHTPALTAKDAFKYFAGVLANRKYTFQKDFKELYGEEEFNKLTFDEEYYWTTAYFNIGTGGAKEKLKNRGENYVKVWEGEIPEDNYIWKFNARQRTDFTYLLNELGLFNYP
jgi:hypothetical protein